NFPHGAPAFGTVSVIARRPSPLNRMLRLLFIIPTLDRSGAEKQLTLLATRLPRDEFDIEVCALTRGGPYEAELRAASIPVTVLDNRLKTDPAARNSESYGPP